MKDFLEWVSGVGIWTFFLLWFFGSSIAEWSIRFVRELRTGRAQKRRLRLKEGKVFLVNGPSGDCRIVHAVDAADAKLLGAQDMGVVESKCDATEVYDRVLRK